MRCWIRFGDGPTGGGARHYLPREDGEDAPPALHVFHDELQDDALAATAHLLQEGTGEVALIARLRRLPDLTHEDFLRYWREEHSHFGLSIPGVRRYEQFHLDVGADIDGIAVVEFNDLDDLHTGLRSDIIAVEARADEENFIDHSRSDSYVCRVDR